MRVLVTGGAGFIGSHLSERVLQLGHSVTIIDDLNNFYSRELKQRNLDSIRCTGQVEFCCADIRNARKIEAIVSSRKPEAIVHLAARAGVRPSLADPLLYEQVNVQGTIALLEAARLHRVRKFVFASSSSIYGVANRVPFSEEDTVNLPISPYAATKIAGEKVCYTWSHLYSLPVVCLRFFTVFGPRQRPDLAIRKFTELIHRGEPVPVFGDGTTGRDYTFVSDIVDGIVAAMGFDCQYEIFNLGNSRPVDLNEMIGTIEQVLQLKADRRTLPAQPGDVPITYADISKAERLLGYRPKVDFAAGIARFVEWHLGIQETLKALAAA